MKTSEIGGVALVSNFENGRCLHLKGYVYRFYDEHDEIVYIGVTQDIKSRISLHFIREDSEGAVRQIPAEELENIKRVEYTETSSFSNARVLEAYLIAKCKPKFNNDFVEDDELTYELVAGDLVWREYPIYNHGENPNQNLRIYDDWGKLLYEIPYIKAFYEPVQELLGITADLSKIRYCTALVDNGYKVIRIKKDRNHWKKKREGTWQAQQQA